MGNTINTTKSTKISLDKFLTIFITIIISKASSDSDIESGLKKFS